MHLFKDIILLFALAGISKVMANTPIHESRINTPGGNWNLAGSAAPYVCRILGLQGSQRVLTRMMPFRDWHFTFTERCYPTSAFYDSTQTQPHRGGLNDCPPPTRNGKGRSVDFPTYFLTR
jgi:hypothetical protein